MSHQHIVKPRCAPRSPWLQSAFRRVSCGRCSNKRPRSHAAGTSAFPLPQTVQRATAATSLNAAHPRCDALRFVSRLLCSLSPGQLAASSEPNRTSNDATSTPIPIYPATTTRPRHYFIAARRAPQLRAARTFAAVVANGQISLRLEPLPLSSESSLSPLHSTETASHHHVAPSSASYFFSRERAAPSHRHAIADARTAASGARRVGGSP